MNNILNTRKEKGISQLQLAEALKVTQATISRWESGIREPDIKNLIKLSILLDTSIDDLIVTKELKEEFKKDLKKIK